MNKLIQNWVNLGFSIIPTDNEKKPLCRWKAYQSRKPIDIELNHWFAENDYNPAVVCGSISGGLLILDCDDPHIADLLEIETLTIRTPSGGLHLYIRSKKIPDKAQAYHGYALDIQAEKSYALLPPAKTEKGEYTIIKDAPIREFDDILEYLNSKLPEINVEQEKNLQKFKKAVGTKIIEKWVKKENEGHNYWKGKCPFHGDTNPSLTIYDNGFYCFGCGEHGDVIEFAMKIENINFKAALSRLSEITGIKAPELKENTDSGDKNRSQASDLIKYVESDDIELFHDEKREPYACIELNAHYTIMPVRDRAFKRWITQQYYNETGKAAGNDAINTALNVIEAKACFDGREYTLHNRICWNDGTIW